MDMLFVVLIAVAVALAGCSITFALVREKSHRSEVDSLNRAHDKTIVELKEAHERSLREQLDAVRSQMTVETEKLLKSREQELEQGNRSNIDEILRPLKESMDKMERVMKENAREHLESTATLKSKLEQAVKEMGEKTSAVGAKADSLSEALTGRPKVQGCWGENFLDDILSREGLVNGIHYTREDANEDLSRPDFVFHFKEGTRQKDLVVDSKVSLTAYVNYMNAQTLEEKDTALSEHLKSVRKHIEELSRKDYSRKIDKSRRFADYVLMFMPVDMAFRVALDGDPMLWQDAYAKGVLIATEQTIMPFLKVIQLTWNKYRQDTSIAEITKAAEDMIERVGLFYDSYKELGSRIRAVCKEYNAGINKLEDSGRSITTSARKVMQIGAKRAKGKEFTVPDQQVFLTEEDSLSEQDQ